MAKTERQKQAKVKKTDKLDDLFLSSDIIKHGFNALEVWPKWETGIPLVDFITDGGIPKGRITLCSGPPSSGKSTVYMKTAATVQKAGKWVIWVDAEGAFVGKYARELGIDTSDEESFRLIPSKSLEDTFDLILRLVQHPNVGLIVIDSIAYLKLKQQLENGVDDNLVGGIAKKLKHCLTLVRNKIDEVGSETAVCLVAQEYDAIGAYSPSGTTPKKVGGGMFAQYDASLHLGFRQAPNGFVMGKERDLVTGVMSEKDVQVGTKIRCKVLKTRMTEPLRETQFVFLKGHGIDDVFSMVEIAWMRKLIAKKPQAYFEVPGKYRKDGKDWRIQGEEKVRQHFRDNPDLYKLLEADIMSLIQNNISDDIEVSDPMQRDADSTNIVDLLEED